MNQAKTNKIEFGAFKDAELKFSVVVARYNGKWIFTRHKLRSSFELAGGHIENGETPEQAARRELREETGALEFTLFHICDYCVDDESKGALFFAEVTKLGKLEYEIQEIVFACTPPQSLTYPHIIPALFKRVQMWLNVQSGKGEIWDVYDKDRNKTGRTHVRGQPMEDGDYHMVVHIWIKNTANQFLITQRAPCKGFSLMWETVGGSATQGEDSLTAALREVKEETGLTLSGKNARLIHSYMRECEFIDVWLINSEYNLKDVVLLPNETIGARSVSLEELIRMTKENSFYPYRYFYEILNIL